MEQAQKVDESGNGHGYGVSIPATRPLGDYQLRLLPRHPLASVPSRRRRFCGSG